MPKPKGRAKTKATTTWTPAQVVAHNLTRARHLRGLTQAEVAHRLSAFTGAPWSQATVAQAEGSVSGVRVRQFSAVELVALARVFDLPVVWFFLPPEQGASGLATPDSPARGWPWEYLLVLVWGHAKNYGALAERAADWAHASTVVSVPEADVLEGEPDEALLGGWARNRERYGPEDMLAVAFAGLARKRMRGSMRPGEEVASLAQSLRGLADALDAFNNYRPGTFFAEELRDATADPGGSEGEG
jgi:transcriptional regulator with XRE-family HTH domain